MGGYHSLDEGEEMAPLLASTPHWGLQPLPSHIYICVLCCSSITCSSSCPLSLFSLLHRKSARLRRSPAEIFSPPPPPSSCVVGVPGGSSTSAAPLERGIGGRRQAAQVTEYGSAARLWCSSSRPWGRKVIVRHHPRLFAGTLSRLWSTRVSPSRQRFDRYLHLLDMILGFLLLQP